MPTQSATYFRNSLKRIFGGAGIYAEGLMFGIVFDETIYLRVDAVSIPDFEREGSTPFVYPLAKSPDRLRRPSQSFWRLPERFYDDPDELALWAGRALAIAEHKRSVSGIRDKRKPSSRSSAEWPQIVMLQRFVNSEPVRCLTIWIGDIVSI